MANPSVFDDYFRRADLDKDGRISGAEAVSFFQGANLPQVTLAKIWQFADQGQTGFLSKLEFYNALKLVTVAQTGRELTQEIVRAALAGPAAAQIPAPSIVALGTQSSSYGVPSVSPQTSASSFSDQFSSGPAAPSRSWSSHPTSLPSAVIPRPGSASEQRPSGGFSSDTWPSIRSSAPAPLSTAVSVVSTVPSYQAGATPSSSLGSKDAPGGLGMQLGSDNVFSGVSSKASIASKFASSPLVDAFGSGPFAATKAMVPAPVRAASSSEGFGDFGGGGFRAEPATVALVPTIVPSRGANKEAHQAAYLPTQASMAVVGQGFVAPSPAGKGLGARWPRMTASDTQRYTRVFAEVDTDRDGKITGEQARDLFLSWRLPREVLKQVWDLSDQDGDSMLSMREFCTALYLMERYREGRPLPPVLPSGFFAEEPQPSVPTSSMERTGVLQPAGTVFPAALGSIPAAAPDHTTSSQVPNSAGSVVDTAQVMQHKAKAPLLEMYLVNQLSQDEQDTLRSRHKDAEEADNKAHELDKEIMDYRERAEFYRSKLQEIILFKSRCENRLGEITERAAADKREMESLAKKYDERFKAAGEVNSRLLTQEAAFRDIQEEKIELYNAIAKMEQGGEANGLLQGMADQISSDLEKLKKVLDERANQFGLNLKATTPTGQQFGWQPGLQEKAEEWDEDWDKFDDEGFVSVQDFMDDGIGGSFMVSVPKPGISWEDNSPFHGGLNYASTPKSGHNVDVSTLSQSAANLVPLEHSTPQAESEGSVRSGHESPTLDSASSLQAVERNSLDRPANATKANQRYGDLSELQEDMLNGPTTYSSTTNSFDQGPSSYNSGNDTFGDGGAWAAAFGHDEEVDSGLRASWGLKTNPPSTQASLDVTSSRASRFGKVGLSSPGFGDSLDIEQLHFSSPGHIPDVSSPAPSHHGDGNCDVFGPLGTPKDFQSFFRTNHNTNMNNTLLDSPRMSSAGNEQSFARFDSFSSPQNNPAFSGLIHDNQDSKSSAGGKEQLTLGFARFDSFSSVKTDGGHGSTGIGTFSSFDEGDDLFTGTGPFGEGSNEKTCDHGWRTF